MSEQGVELEHRITPLELFFDLVFVFAFTQVTTVFLHDQTWSGLGHGLLILAVLWWAWASYAWLTNSLDAGDDVVLAVVLVALAAMFVAAIAVPEAFADHGVLFGLSFLIVVVVHLALNASAARGNHDRLAPVLRIVPSSLAGAACVLLAGFADGTSRSVLWVAALAVGFVAPLVIRVDGWRLAPAHFVERHGLIVIIAIGESLIAVGLGARGTDLDAGVVAAAVLGFVVATSFWLAYFDFFPLRAERLLTERQGPDRVALARDIYSYLHFPMVAGIALFAFATEVTIAHVGHELDVVPAFALCAGPALYLSAFVALRVRVSGTLSRGRLVAALACAALFPVALAVPALAAIALVATVWVSLHLYEIIWWREARAAARALRLQA
jgi:low temperature requirement protein LtrA